MAPDIFSAEYASALDQADPLSRFRSEFYIPTLADLKRPTLAQPADEPPSTPCTYLCGNSLGLQPVRTATLVDQYLRQWRTKGVTGHFVDHTDSSLPPFLHIDDRAATLVAPVVGAASADVAVLGSLTANLHLLLASFYRPGRQAPGRSKILLEGKAFPSDHYVVESQIRHHDLDPADTMILLEPPDPASPLLTTAHILDAIDAHASDLALILLPGVQFYSGQAFDVATITARAHAHGIVIGWDLAHSVGNVELKLHEWDVDFAAWCSYKYLNAGPGAMAGIFVNPKYGPSWPRLTGWWGHDTATRFHMTNEFAPRPGAAGFQLSNPSAIDLAAVVASLEVFNETSMGEVRAKSLRLTGYLEQLLDAIAAKTPRPTFDIITPRNPAERGAQLSIRLAPGLLDVVLEHLEDAGVIVDDRKPDVIRVAPAPLYNTFADVLRFCHVFEAALGRVA